jgi:hypothetical protein
LPPVCGWTEARPAPAIRESIHGSLAHTVPCAEHSQGGLERVATHDDRVAQARPLHMSAPDTADTRTHESSTSRWLCAKTLFGWGQWKRTHGTDACRPEGGRAMRTDRRSRLRAARGGARRRRLRTAMQGATESSFCVSHLTHSATGQPTNTRREDQPGSDPLSHALRRPEPLPAPREPIDDNLTFTTSWAQCLPARGAGGARRCF